MPEFNRDQLIGHMNALRKYVNIKGKNSKRFATAIFKNAKLLDPVMEAIQEKGKPEKSEGVIAYEKERDAKLTKFARKDPGGNPLKDPNGVFAIDPKHFEESKKIQTALEKKHKIACDEIRKHNERFEKYMAEKIEVSYQRVLESELPNDDISGQMLLDLDFMLVIPLPK